ncbi:MAG: glycosyltransferase [Thermoguttaceae bacterium]|nr:glycosyltransferase [Thermoguttaceae bacterium]
MAEDDNHSPMALPPRHPPMTLPPPPTALPPKAALCITELDRGGAEKIFSLLALALAKECPPVVYSLRARSYHRKGENFIDLLESGGIEVIFLNVRGPLSALTAIVRLARSLRRRRIEVFQSFMFHANIIGRLAAKLAGVPAVFSGLRVSEKKKLSHLRIDRATAPLVDGWICVSRSVADYSVRIGRLPPERVTVIPNAVTAEPLPDSAADEMPPALFPPYEQDRRRKAVVVGRLTEQKGVDWLLETVPLWLGGSDVPDWELWLIGDGDQRRDLERTAAALPHPVREKIHFAGWRPDIPAILAAADLLLLPSRWEGMPNALLEAALAKKAVLATLVDGVEEVLGGENLEEQTCAFGDTDVWTRKVKALMADTALRGRLAEANRRRVQTEFSVEKMVERYRACWTERLAAKRK